MFGATGITRLDAFHHKNLISLARRQTASALTLAVLLVSAFLTPPSARAQSIDVLYRFHGGADGSDPRGVLVQDSSGNLYGTTLDGLGRVFKVEHCGGETADDPVREGVFDDDER